MGITLENAWRKPYHTDLAHKKRARRRIYSGTTKENMGSKVKSDFLVAHPSLASGAARLFDFYALYDEYNISPTEAQADAMATFADWLVVGQDIREAVEHFERLQNAS